MKKKNTNILEQVRMAREVVNEKNELDVFMAIFHPKEFADKKLMNDIKK